MPTPQTEIDTRRRLNPLFNDNKLKLGLFGVNVSNGCAITTAVDRHTVSWPTNLAIAQTADKYGYEAMVPVARWRGFGGATDPQGPGFETFTWAAGIAGATRHSGVISTAHVALNHPIVAASNRPSSTTSQTAAIRSMSSMGGIIRKWKCSACRSLSTRTVTPVPRNG